jgi:hypothetical protein
VARKFGGIESRFYQVIYQEAKRLHRVDQQIEALLKLGETAIRQKNIDLALHHYQFILTLSVPTSPLLIVRKQLWVLQYLSYLANTEAEREHAKEAYELLCSQYHIPRRPLPFRLLLWLCIMTQGDQERHERYIHQIIREPEAVEFTYAVGKLIAQSLDITIQREYYARCLNWRELQNQHLLWQWAQVEYERGDKVAACQLGRMACLRQEDLFDRPTTIMFDSDYRIYELWQAQWQKMKQRLKEMGCEG